MQSEPYIWDILLGVSVCIGMGYNMSPYIWDILLGVVCV